MKLMPACVLLLVFPAFASDPPRSARPAEAELYIIAPRDGETVTSPVRILFGLRGMGVAPARVAVEGTGHHHLLVDAAPPALDAPIPADGHHIHFGKGQTETMLVLEPGRHRLQLLLGDHLHRPHDPPLASTPVTITVAP